MEIHARAKEAWVKKNAGMAGHDAFNRISQVILLNLLRVLSF
jgi:hypothetical protein